MKFLHVILRIAVVIGISFMHIQTLFGQSDLAALKKYSIDRKESFEMTNSDKRYQQNPTFFPIRIFYKVYRSVISEQISANCAFDLTCSRFSANAYSQLNFFKASFLTFDRLTRCHPLISSETPPFLFNTKIGKVIDVPEMY